ncbi:MAG: ATPase [Candidatus Aenigmarchaeota archaeon]|nr:ATPase [Candidatus Aenigmarchaeota archaeon]NIP40739.1 ATPase [Candidatus Aenigmarchaeota archaeon]NIQ18545.1 ATPase [Candidatus Aenigmarchaeota archaeon]NIS73444.1 ATPase [Candidatus Aenigmarchaeota archaeon]
MIERIKKKNDKKIVPDTSVLINKKLTELVEKGKLDHSKIIIPRIVIDELQAQASRGKDTGFRGLDEIKKIRKLCDKHKISLSFDGTRPTQEDINLAKKGRIDALIRDFAVKEHATLLTSDYVQALVGEAEDVSIWYVPFDIKGRKIKLEEFFTPDTQSVHLKVGVKPYAKRGKPGDVKLVNLRDKSIEDNELKSIIYEILSKTHKDPSSFIEIGKHGAMVVQMGRYRISITRPPFSSGTEVTAVRPIVKLSLADYKLHKQLEEMIVSGYQGVLIAGPPGSGKSTFAASIAEFLSKKGKIVKTFEQPRDLQVGPEITQYAPLENDWEKTAELLLLVRPDYTIFDEIRKTRDFRVFADMRLAGVGMIGVVHSTDLISAIQRFIGRIELGMIPHVIDTVIYIKNGNIEKTYTIGLTVKVPTGMTEQDLARPVVEVRDFETKKLEYEIYTFGEENVIIQVEKPKETPLRRLATKTIEEEISRYDRNPKVEFLSDNRIVLKVRNDVIPKIIGRRGKTIEEIEKKTGMKISVEPIEEIEKKTGMKTPAEPIEKTRREEIKHLVGEKGAYFNIKVEKKFTGQQVDIYSGDEYLFSPVVGKNGYIRIRKRSEEGSKVLRAISSKNLKVMV